MTDGTVHIYEGKVLIVGGKVALCDDDCCGCDCTCTNCADNSAPCCWKVVISGMAEGTCGQCASLDKTYYLPQSEANDCLWINRCAVPSCDPDDIQLAVVKENGDYIIRVTLGSHVWEKNYGATRPTCCGMTNEVLPHDTSGGDCDSSSATCTITGDNDIICNSECCDDYCENGEAPDAIKVTFAGWAGGATCTDDECGCIDGTYTLTGSNCSWSTAVALCSICGFGAVSATLWKDGNNYKLKVTAAGSEWRHDFGTTKPNCLAWAGVSMSLHSDGSIACSAAGVSVTVSAAHGATRTYDDTKRCLQCDCDESPEEFEVVASGFANGHCLGLDCGDLNGTFVLGRVEDCECCWATSGLNLTNCACEIIGEGLLEWCVVLKKTGDDVKIYAIVNAQETYPCDENSAGFRSSTTVSWGTACDGTQYTLDNDYMCEYYGDAECDITNVVVKVRALP